ncbi:MAG: GNAT family N-acetyltransferase [Atopobiaceae bacterium]|nr:GNAT family N-acetyltransferase [Atopobiaceae bacterium]
MVAAIERASLDDLDQLIKLRLAYLADDFGALDPEQIVQIRETLPGYLHKHLDTDLLAFVARAEDGAIMSCAWLLLVEKPPSPRFPNGRTGVLFNVYTAPQYRRQGLARRTMGALIEEAYRLRLDVLELHATEDGYPLYRSLGFSDDSTTHKAMRLML